MARSSAAPPPINSVNFLGWLREAIDRMQRKDEDFEPPHGVGVASRVVLTDSNGVRYAVTVNTSGSLVVTAL